MSAPSNDQGEFKRIHSALELDRTTDVFQSTPAATVDFGQGLRTGISNDELATAVPRISGLLIAGEIARGGMGRIFAARDLTLDRELVVKTLLPGANADRFVTEAMITARLAHPGIPPVHSLGVLEDGTPYLTMKLVRGRTLNEQLQDRANPLDQLSHFLQVFEQIAHAVGFAHSQGVIHRDLKPLNVMVGQFAEVQVMDWGLAKKLDQTFATETADLRELHSEATQDGIILGTPSYMAPEQARAEAVDARTDVFALGSILAVILTGRPAFVGCSVRETVAKAAAADLTDLRARLAACQADPELIDLAVRCLAPHKEDRPTDGQAVAREVAAYRAGVETRLRRLETQRAEMLVRQAEEQKRRRVWVALAASLGVGVMLVSLLAAWINRARHQEQLARQELSQKKTELENSLQTVSERTKLALEAFQELGYGIQTKLDVRPDTQALRKELMLVARAGLQNMLDDAREQGKPDQTLFWIHVQMGDLELELGNTPAAETEYQAVGQLARQLSAADPESGTLLRLAAIGIERQARASDKVGRLTTAYDQQQQAHQIFERLANEHPDLATVEEDLSNSYARLGEFAYALGRTREAEILYRKKLAHDELRLQQGPDDPDLQYRLAIAYGKLVTLLSENRQLEQARQVNQQAIELLARSNRSDPDNLNRQGQMAQLQQIQAELTLALGKSHDALSEFQAVLATRERLAKADPLNVEHQSALSKIYCLIGDVHLTLGNDRLALETYSLALPIAHRLADADSRDQENQQRLARIYNRLGKVRQQLGQLPDAVVAFEQSLAIAQRSVENSPEKVGLHRNLITALSTLGNVQLELGRVNEAQETYRKMLESAQELSRRDEQTNDNIQDLGRSYGKLGDVQRKLGNIEEALATYLKALEFQQQLAKENPDDLEFVRDFGITISKVGRIRIGLGMKAEGRRDLENYVAVCRRLSGLAPDNIASKTDLFISCFELGSFLKFELEYEQAIPWFKEARSVILPLHEMKLLPSQFANSVAHMDREILQCQLALQAIADEDSIFQQLPGELTIQAGIRVRWLVKQQRLSEAVELADRYLKWGEMQDKDRDQWLYNAACRYALCAGESGTEADRLIEQCLALLRRVRSTGYLNARIIGQIEKDRIYFEKIRNHPKFVEFWREVEPAPTTNPASANPAPTE